MSLLDQPPTRSLPTNTNKPTAKDLDAKTEAAIDKYLSTQSSLTVGGVAYTPTTLKAVFQTDSDACNATAVAHAAWRQSVANERKVHAATRAVRKALRAYLIGLFGVGAVQVFEDFGFTVPKEPGPKTVEAKSQAVEKSLATRKARHTMGRVQKQQVHGTVQGPAPAGAPPKAPGAQ